LDEPAIAEAARLSTDGAKPLAKNGYKVPLTQALVRRALTKLATA
jgi:CO/xanthine dehydrogenase FAD-binding subunit